MDMASNPVALQLYTVREDTAKDFVGTLRRVAEIGYRAVELAGTGGLSAVDLKAALDDLGLRVAGSHLGLDALTTNFDATAQYNRIIGNPFLVCPGVPEERRNSAAAWRDLAKTFNEIGKKAHAAGFGVAYHNHNAEFTTYDGQAGLDIFLADTDPKLVGVELDVFWARYAGVDPAAYMAKHPGRFPLLHLKDMAKDEKSFAEVGEGIIDFKAIFAQAKAAGAQWNIVEQDTCARPPLESVRISLENLKKWSVAG